MVPVALGTGVLGEEELSSDDIDELKDHALRLEKELEKVQEKLNRLGELPIGSSVVLPPPGHSGYLFKWQDRSIGWGGANWALRFVLLDRGRISYYYSHLESSPRYTLSLRGCAVSDEGWKRNRRHVSKTTPKGKDPPLEEVGAYFFVFSIYHHQDESSSSHGEAGDIVPLLRFSTPSLAEKDQWIELLSEACAYCETDAFLKEEATRNAEEEFRRQQQINMAEAMPQAERGTLPPLYFASDNSRTKKLNRPSFSKLPKSENFRTVAKTQDAEKSENKGFPQSTPMHRSSAPSYLSDDAKAQNYRGFFNLAMIILIVSNFRLIVHSVRQYGFVLAGVSDFDISSMESWNVPFVLGMFALQLFLVGGYLIELLLANKKVPDNVGMILHQLNALCSFAVSIYIVWNFIEKPALGVCVMTYAAITWMKLISYAYANQDYRLSSQSKDQESHHKATLAIIDNLDQNDFYMEYPRNVTLGNIYYFWLAPTLTYQIAFPKTPRVRPLRVLSILLHMVFVFSLSTFLVAQVVAPNLENLLNDLKATNGKYTYAILGEYGLRLSIANTYVWLLFFYFYFHLWLNLWAELLRFGDRVFYKDWWNSGELSAYWRLWNLPVHYWCVRHLYFPCVRWNVPKQMASHIVFFFSAVMHEAVISIPLHILRPWAFLAMMGQIPLTVVTKYFYDKYPGSSVGNILFWLSFCVIGQPMAILLYTIDYHYGQMQQGESETFHGERQVCTDTSSTTCLVN